MRKLGFVVTAALAIALAAGGAAAVSSDAPRAPAASSSATADGAVWPMPIDKFLAGKYLDRSDIILTRRDNDAVSYLIRWATASIFSHAALVFTGPQFEQGYTSTFVIEAGTRGVDLTKLDDYVTDNSSFVAVKRLKQPWFDDTKRARVRGIMLDKIKASYNYWAVGRIARNIWFGVQQKVQGKEKTIETYRERAWSPPQEFICSGLVQLGFIEAALSFIESDQMAPSALTDVIFHHEAASRLPDEDGWNLFPPGQAKETAILFGQQLASELQSVTPEDLAQSDKLEWLYFIRGGFVHKIASYDDAKRLSK